MRRSVLTIFIVVMVAKLIAQPPTGYYDSAANKGCAALKTALKTIISTNDRPQSYSGLWTQYPLTDIKPRTVDSGSANVIYDVYSSIPNGIDPYQFTPNTNQCGNYTGEGICYNREHSVPLSWFNGNTSVAGTATDYNFIFPTDGYVNGKRANFPYSEVATAKFTSKNGSKLDTSAVAGITGTVFEPRDEFKGDLARAFLYFVTMYEDSIATWSNNVDAHQSFDSSRFPAVKLPFLQLMIKWHNQDPVSQKEIDRNNGTYAFQKNRNPFIDSPQYVNQIWNSSCPGLISLPVNLVYFTGNPNGTSVALQWQVNNETNLTVYEIESSVNGQSYTKIGAIYANNSSNYSFSDNSIYGNGEVVYYRLKKIDKDGKYSYSKVLSIQKSAGLKAMVYPNPAGSYLYLSLNATTTLPVSISLTDVMGHTVLNRIVKVTGNNIAISIKDIGRGCYYLSVKAGDTKYTQQVMIVK